MRQTAVRPNLDPKSGDSPNACPPAASYRVSHWAACACGTRITSGSPALRGQMPTEWPGLRGASLTTPHGNPTPGHIGTFPPGRSSSDYWRTWRQSESGQIFERPTARGRDSDAADLDRLSACPDKLPPCCRVSFPHKEKEHRTRKSTSKHDRLGDAVHAGTGEQDESAPLLGTNPTLPTGGVGRRFFGVRRV